MGFFKELQVAPFLVLAHRFFWAIYADVLEKLASFGTNSCLTSPRSFHRQRGGQAFALAHALQALQVRHSAQELAFQVEKPFYS